MTGLQVRAMRRALGLTQPQLAERIGVSAGIVSVWEQKGDGEAKPMKRSRQWDALIAFLSTASPKSSAPAGPVDPIAAARVNETVAAPEQQRVEYDSAGLLYPWLETAGPEYRARIRREIEACR